MSSTKRRKVAHDPSKSTYLSTSRTQSHIHPARRARVAQSQNTASQDVQASADTNPNPPTSSRPFTRDRNSASSKIHSLRRQLQNPNTQLPADIRTAKERELRGLLSEQRKNVEERERKRQIKKYHFVRFMERKKAEKNLRRLLSKVQKIGENDSFGVESDSSEELAAKIEEAKVNLAYTIYAPLADKYIGIFVEESQNGDGADSDPNTDGSDASGDDTLDQFEGKNGRSQPEKDSGRPERRKNAMWQTIKAVMGDQPALEELRHRSPLDVNEKKSMDVKTRRAVSTTTELKNDSRQSQLRTSRDKASTPRRSRGSNAVEGKGNHARDDLMTESTVQVDDSAGDKNGEEDFFKSAS